MLAWSSLPRYAFASCILAIFATFPDVPASAQDAAGISSSALSRCAGRAGLDARESDAAFGVIMLDGMPWVTIEKTDEQVGTQKAATAVTGSGMMRRRNGSLVPIRFTCMLDAKGQALMFYGRKLLPGVRDELMPARLIFGSATYLERMALPRGAELRVQLLDTSGLAGGEVLAEQVVRSGWAVPIPFVLRLPKDTSLDNRKLVLTARLAQSRQTLFQLKEPFAIAADRLKHDELRLGDELVLAQVQATKR
jgi:uncharacterized lipoprotein YbaY